MESAAGLKKRFLAAKAEIEGLRSKREQEVVKMTQGHMSDAAIAKVEALHQRLRTGENKFLERLEKQMHAAEVAETAAEAQRITDLQAKARLEDAPRRAMARHAWIKAGGDPNAFDAAYDERKQRDALEQALHEKDRRPPGV